MFNVRFPNVYEIFSNKWTLSIYAVASLKFREKLSASVFYVPGKCTVDTHIFCDVNQTHSSFAILLQNPDLIPRIMLSDITLTFSLFSPLQYACTSKDIAFNSSTLMRFISSVFHVPLDKFFSSVTSHPIVL